MIPHSQSSDRTFLSPTYWSLTCPRPGENQEQWIEWGGQLEKKVAVSGMVEEGFRTVRSVKSEKVTVSPLGWEHINLTGDYLWRNNAREDTEEVCDAAGNA